MIRACGGLSVAGVRALEPSDLSQMNEGDGVGRGRCGWTERFHTIMGDDTDDSITSLNEDHGERGGVQGRHRLPAVRRAAAE